MVAMELYLGSIIEPIRKSSCNTLYFNSKHAPKTFGEAMQKTQDLNIRHLYALGEDQQESSTKSLDILPEIMVNKVNTHDNRGWYRNRCESRDYSQNSRELNRPNNYAKKVTFRQPHGTQTDLNSEHSDYSPE